MKRLKLLASFFRGAAAVADDESLRLRLLVLMVSLRQRTNEVEPALVMQAVKLEGEVAHRFLTCHQG